MANATILSSKARRQPKRRNDQIGCWKFEKPAGGFQMKQELYECGKCKLLMEGRRYCLGCGAHTDDLTLVTVYTQSDVDELMKNSPKKSAKKTSKKK